MPKTEQNITISENFIREVLEKNFRQEVPADALRSAALKLCAALPEQRKAAA